MKVNLIMSILLNNVVKIGIFTTTKNMKIERKIREELGWKGVSRSLKYEEADLTGLFFRIRK